MRDIDVPVNLLDMLQKLHNEQREANLRTGYRDPKNLAFRNSSTRCQVMLHLIVASSELKLLLVLNSQLLFMAYAIHTSAIC